MGVIPGAPHGGGMGAELRGCELSGTCGEEGFSRCTCVAPATDGAGKPKKAAHAAAWCRANAYGTAAARAGAGLWGGAVALVADTDMYGPAEEECAVEGLVSRIPSGCCWNPRPCDAVGASAPRRR